MGRLHLFVDASGGLEDKEGGLGAALFQEDSLGNKRPVAYASRVLKTYEKNYSAFLLELQAAVFGIDHFATYLRGCPFVLYTDHKPMTKFSKVHTKTLNRLQLKMQEYSFEIRYIKGEDNVVVDYLSRNVSVVDLIDQNAGLGIAQMDLRQSRIQTMQQLEPELKHWSRIAKNEVPDDRRVKFPLIMMKGILMVQMPIRKGFSERRIKIVASTAMRKEIIK